MAELNPIVKAKAARIAIAKSKRISELDLTPQMSDEERDAKAYDLATAKALTDGGEVADYLEGQSWYVNDLCEFAALTPEQRFQVEYDKHIVAESSVDDIVAMIASA